MGSLKRGTSVYLGIGDSLGIGSAWQQQELMAMALKTARMRDVAFMIDEGMVSLLRILKQNVGGRSSVDSVFSAIFDRIP